MGGETCQIKIKLKEDILLKKYIKQNAHLVGFNVDPKFNNAVDGLLYIRIADLPDSTVKPVLEEFQAELERKLSQEKNGTCSRKSAG